jgi:hypothetical protein
MSAPVLPARSTAAPRLRADAGPTQRRGIAVVRPKPRRWRRGVPLKPPRIDCRPQVRRGRLAPSGNRDVARPTRSEISYDPTRPGGDLEARAGIEPAHRGFADLGLTTWLPRPNPRAVDVAGKKSPRKRQSANAPPKRLSQAPAPLTGDLSADGALSDRGGPPSKSPRRFTDRAAARPRGRSPTNARRPPRHWWRSSPRHTRGRPPGRAPTRRRRYHPRIRRRCSPDRLPP